MEQNRATDPASVLYAPTTESNSRLPVFIGAGAVLGCLGVLCVITLAVAAMLGSARARPAAVATVTINASETAEISTPFMAATQTPVASLLPVITVTPAALALTTTVAPAPTVTSTASLTIAVETTERQVRIFQKLWDVVNTRYIYTDFNGLDWNTLRVTTLEKIQTGMTDDQFYASMADVVDALKDNHSSFLSPQDAHEEQSEYAGDGKYTGIGIISDINIQKHYAYVLQVLPGSPAEKAGIRAHEHIISINGQPSVLPNDTINLPMLRGPEGSTVTVTVRASDGPPRTLIIKRSSLSTSTPVAHRLIISGTRRIGYLMIPTLFEESVGDEVRAALDDLMKKGRLDGLVIDLRINGGGAYPVLMRCLGFFTSGTVGSLTSRSGTQQSLTVRIEKVGNSQTVPIMVLVGHATVSYAEVYAGILRSTGRARLIGQNSGGNIETLRAHDFEDGSRAWIAEETFRLPDGGNWEGQGLTPDIPVDKAWDDITDENDPVIAAALKAF